MRFCCTKPMNTVIVYFNSKYRYVTYPKTLQAIALAMVLLTALNPDLAVVNPYYPAKK